MAVCPVHLANLWWRKFFVCTCIETYSFLISFSCECSTCLGRVPLLHVSHGTSFSTTSQVLSSLSSVLSFDQWLVCVFLFGMNCPSAACSLAHGLHLLLLLFRHSAWKHCKACNVGLCPVRNYVYISDAERVVRVYDFWTQSFNWGAHLWTRLVGYAVT